MRDRGDGNRLGLLPDHSHLRLKLQIPVQRQLVWHCQFQGQGVLLSGCIRSAGSLCSVQRKVLMEGYSQGVQAFLFSALVMPKSIIHSRAEEGGSSNGSPVREQNYLNKRVVRTVGQT